MDPFSHGSSSTDSTKGRILSNQLSQEVFYTYNCVINSLTSLLLHINACFAVPLLSIIQEQETDPFSHGLSSTDSTKERILSNQLSQEVLYTYNCTLTDLLKTIFQETWILAIIRHGSMLHQSLNQTFFFSESLGFPCLRKETVVYLGEEVIMIKNQIKKVYLCLGS